MAEGGDPAEKLRDVIEGLRSGKVKKTDLDDSDDEFHESFEQVGDINAKSSENLDTDKDISDLEKELKELKLERKKIQLRKEIEKERESLKNLQVFSHNPQIPAVTTHAVVSGEQNNCIQHNMDQKALQILSFIWPEPIEQYQTFTLSGDVEFRVGKKKTLDKVTIEEWGYANVKIMQELVKQKRLKNINGYLNYTADIYRLASRHVWHSVLLYDMEYRQKQAEENFDWGTYRQDLRDFQLVTKRDNPTTRAFSDASKAKGRNMGTNKDDRRKGPFLPDGREICRSFNYNSCFRTDCKMMHNCAICFSSAHSAINGHSQPSTQAKNRDVPQIQP